MMRGVKKQEATMVTSSMTGTFRRDGSSRFAARNRWGNFPALALGWVISNEPFFEGVPAVSFLKLRGSWGLLGNDKIRTDAATATVVSTIDNRPVTAVFGENEDIHTGRTVAGLANPELKWEETEQVNIGFELNLLSDRLTTEVDWYRRFTSDILVPVEIPRSVGASAPVVNAADVLNRGFDFSVQWRDVQGDFFYSIGVNGSTIYNEVRGLGEGLEDILAGGVGDLGLTTRTVVGQPIGSFYGFKVDGIFQDQNEIDASPSRAGDQPGDLKLVDITGNGEINDDDKVFLGSPIPDFVFGFNVSAGWKNFDLSMDFDGQTGNMILNGRNAIRGFRRLNYDRTVLKLWTAPGTSNTEPRVTESGRNFEVDRFLEKGDFLRLRNIQLGYSLPDTPLLRRARVFANSTNLFTLTGFNGYNPQVGGGPGNGGRGSVTSNGIALQNLYPLARSFTFGIEIDF
jgi:TonB-linked SusC/RagA family outer membrane protein